MTMTLASSRSSMTDPVSDKDKPRLEPDEAHWREIIGQIGMLFAVILIIRVLPEGLSSVLVRRGR